MIKITVENDAGEKLNLNESAGYEFVIHGLTPASAQLNRDHLAGYDGTHRNSSYVNERIITVEIYPQGDVSSSRLNLYRFFSPGQPIRISVETDERQVYIEGDIESLDGDLYESPQVLTATIICYYPHFKSASESDNIIATTQAMFEFPFVIEGTVTFAQVSDIIMTYVKNEGDKETGVKFIVEAHGGVYGLKLKDLVSKKTLDLYDLRLEDGDILTISTLKGAKTATLERAGQTSNVINYLRDGSEWIQAKRGQNIYSYECSNMNLITVRVVFATEFVGV